MSHSWSVLELGLESRVSDSGIPTLAATPHTHPAGPDAAPSLRLGRAGELGESSPLAAQPESSFPVRLGLGPAAGRAEELHYFKPGPHVGTGRVASGPWPASWKSPWPPSSPVSSFLRQSLPYKQEGGPQAGRPPAPASSSYPQFSLLFRGAGQLHPSPAQCPLSGLTLSR